MNEQIDDWAVRKVRELLLAAIGQARVELDELERTLR